MPKLLIVDDEATITTQLEERLSSLGYEVVGTAASGEEAVTLAKKLDPDLILMDIVMPGKWNGIQAAEVIHREKSIPVVFLTAYGDDKYISKARDVGSHGYLIKPYQEEGLKAAIEIALFNDRITKKLRKSEEQWRTLAENMTDCVILAEDNGKIFFWNRGAESIFGYTADETLGKEMTFILAEGSRENLKKVMRQLATQAEPLSSVEWMETIGLKKDYSKFPVEISLSRWMTKETSFLCGIVRDLTLRKKKEDIILSSLKEKDRLLDDVQNRLHNNLEIIYRLMNLQTDYLQDRDPSRSSREKSERMRSLASVQNKLSESGMMARINFTLYVRNLISRLAHSYDIDEHQIKLTVDTQEIFLEMRTALPCGLLISELVSNALQHAFPDEKKGEVVIRISRRDDKDIVLQVQDNGIGAPHDLDIHKADTVGIQTVRDLVSQLEGHIRMDIKDGTRFTVVFPEDKRH